MKTKRFSLFSTSIAASLILLSPALHADAITWDAGGGDTNWSTLLNWSDDASPNVDDVTFNATGALASGTTNTVSASESIASLSYSQESATLQHTTAISASQTLAVAGNFLLAGSATATTATNVTITGAGALTVGGASFQVGQTTPTSGTPTNSLDMSGLGNLDANLGASGIFRLGGASTVTAGALATVKLAATSTITADIFGVGDRAGRGGLHTLRLGSTANAINANNIYIGPSGSGGRGNGELLFDSGTGALQLRAADGTSAVTAMNLINNSFGTANNQTATANFAGHDVNAKITTLTMGKRNSTGTAASATATFTFDTGTLEVGTLNLGENASANSTTGAILATMNIGGGTASFNAITMAASSAINATPTTTAILNFTGGTTTVNGDIVRGAGVGTKTANLNLSGASAILDMTGDDLTNLTAITYTDGLLKNLGVVNTGMTLAGTGSRVFDQGLNVSGFIQGAITGTGLGLTKQGLGSLTLSGTNTYDGATAINDGLLVFVSKNAKGSGTATSAALGSVGIGVHDANASYYSAAEVGDLFNTNTLAGFNLDPASGVAIETSNAGGSFTQNVALTAARALSKNGTGTMILPGANSFTGNVTINGIANSNTLRIEHSESLGPIATAKNVTLNGFNRQVSILELASNITVDVNKTIFTSGKSAIATDEAELGSSVFLRSASGNNAWLGNILINAGGGGYAIESAAGTLTLGTPSTTSVLRNDVLASTRSFNFLGAGDVVLNSRFVDTDLTTITGINKHGTGTLTLPRTDNQGSSATPVFAVGTTVVENMAASGTQSSIGSGTGFNFGGTFRHVGAANSSSDRAFGLVGPTPTLESSGAGTLSLTNTTPVAFVNGAGSPVAAFGLGVTTLTVRDAFTLFPGMTIAGTGIASGTKITAVNYDTRQITLDTPTDAAQAVAIGGTISGTGDLDRTFTLGGTNTGDNLIAAPIANPSGTGKLALTKADAGKWILTGNNTYTGNTTISGGTLLVNGNQSSATGTVTVDAAATLGGTGTLGGATTVNGSLAPGASAGQLTFTGGLTLGSLAANSLKFELGANTTAGTTYDTVVTNALEIGTLDFADFQFTNTGALAAGAYTLISSTAPITGSLGTSSGSIGSFTGTLSITGGNTLVLTVSGGSPYTTWANSFLPGNDVSNPAGDNDGDGLVNQQEFAFGLSPISGSSVNPILVPLNKTAGTFSYQRRAGTGLTYRILTSTDLVSWPEDTTATLGQIATPSGSNETVVVTLTGTKPLTATKLFVRVAAD